LSASSELSRASSINSGGMLAFAVLPWSCVNKPVMVDDGAFL
jgi:hypothetical protein